MCGWTPYCDDDTSRSDSKMFDRLVHLNSPKNIESISFSMMYSPKKVLIRSNICRIRFKKKAVRIFNRTAFYHSLLLQPQKRLNSAIGFPL